MVIFQLPILINFAGQGKFRAILNNQEWYISVCQTANINHAPTCGYDFQGNSKHGHVVNYAETPPLPVTQVTGMSQVAV